MSDSCLKTLPDLFKVRPIFKSWIYLRKFGLWSHIFGFLPQNFLHTNVSFVCKYWLEIIRNDRKYLRLGAHFLKKYFELGTLKLEDEKLDSMMTKYLTLWPNVKMIEMDWVRGKDIINLKHDIKISRKW